MRGRHAPAIFRGRSLARTILGASLALTIGACQQPSTTKQEDAAATAATGPGNPDNKHGFATGSEMTPLREFMVHVMLRNSEQLWAWTSYVANDKGEGYAKPETDEQWSDAESDAQTIVQLTKILLTPEFHIDDPEWPKYVENLRVAAEKSAVAGEQNDFEAFLASGDEINTQCVACHMHYVPEIERELGE